MQAPLERHWQTMKRIPRHLAGTLSTGLLMKPSSSSSMALEGFCEADWASEPDDKHFTLGFCVVFGSNLVPWQTKKQYRSSIEAEYRSLAHVTTEINGSPHYLMN